MREFSTNIAESLTTGLRPQQVVKDAVFLKDLKNIVPYTNGSRPYEEVINAVDKLATSYPFPQIFFLENVTLVLTGEYLYYADKSYLPFELRKFTYCNFSELSLTKRMYCVDYGDSWILSSPEGTIYKYGEEVNFTSDFKVNSIIQHENRTLFAGIQGDLWNDSWLATLESLEVTGLLDIDSNTVFWSDFDSLIFPFSLLSADLYNELVLSKEHISELMYSASFGFMPHAYDGEILELAAFKEQVFCFGTEGIMTLRADTELPGSGYAMLQKLPFGIKDRTYAYGNDERVVFIDKQDKLYLVTSQGLSRLNFSTYMSMLEGELYITKDPDEPIVYIGSEEKSFLLNESSLARTYQTIHSIFGGASSRIGFFTQTDDIKALIITEDISLDFGGYKTLTGVFLSADSELTGRARCSSQVRGKLVYSPWVNLNKEGYAACRLYGKNHSVEIELSDYKNVNIDSIELKWQVDDNRQTRGIYASQTNS